MSPGQINFTYCCDMQMVAICQNLVPTGWIYWPHLPCINHSDLAHIRPLDTNQARPWTISRLVQATHHVTKHNWSLQLDPRRQHWVQCSLEERYIERYIKRYKSIQDAVGPEIDSMNMQLTNLWQLWCNPVNTALSGMFLRLVEFLPPTIVRKSPTLY